MRASWKTLAHHCSRRGGLWLIQSTPIRSCVAVYHWPEYDGRGEKSRSTNLAWEQVGRHLCTIVLREEDFGWFSLLQEGHVWLCITDRSMTCVEDKSSRRKPFVNGESYWVFKTTETWKHKKLRTTKDNKEQKTEKKKREQAQTGYSFERNCVPCGNLPYGQFAG